MEGRKMGMKSVSKELWPLKSWKVLPKVTTLFIIAWIVFTSSQIVIAGPPPPPIGWYQVNEDGFIPGRLPSDTNLFTFDGVLFAFDGESVFLMNDPITKDWTELTISVPPAGPGPTATFKPFGNYVYSWNSDELWFLQKGVGIWNKVTSLGLSGGVSPFPMASFNGRLYGVYYTPTGAFQIWRTSDIGSSVANWALVVDNSFGDTTNNQSVDGMIVYAGKIYAAVGTLIGLFGDPNGYGTGVEIWESATGNSGSWSQVNIDGFGTLFPGCIPPSGPCNFPIHQVVGSMAVFHAPGQSQAYLYVGTLSHYGAEVWRYNGAGLAGWTNVTPPWAGPCPIGCGPGRNNDMTVFKEELYLAEGYPTANLAKYDGATWSILVEGPPPFDPDHTRFNDLAVLGDRLYATRYYSSSKGDEVWGFPFAAGYDYCVESLSGILIHGFDMVDDIWFMGETATYLGINSGGSLLGWIDGNNFAFYYDAPTGSLGEEGAFHFGHMSDLFYNLTTTSGSFSTVGFLTPCYWNARALSDSMEADGGLSSTDGSTVCFEDDFGYRHTISSDGYHLYGYTENTECGGLLPIVGAVEGEVFSFYLDVPTGHPVCNIEGLMYKGHVSTLRGYWRRTPVGGIDHGTFHLTPCGTAAVVD
jgi:hypothetical protein